MNHAKLETYYRIFDASIVPVCAGGCARLTEALAARLGRKVTDGVAELGRPAAPRRIRREGALSLYRSPEMYSSKLSAFRPLTGPRAARSSPRPLEGLVWDPD